MFSKLQILCLLSSIAYCTATQPINVTSTWIGGSSTANKLSITGTVGVPSTSIYPGGRFGSCFVVSAHDANYQAYLYGGQGYATSSPAALLKDFWRYNLATTEWTMLPENPYSSSVTGTLGVEGGDVFPAYVSRAQCLIRSQENMLYMFAGAGNAVRYNDLWRYNPATGYWAWLGGGTGTTPTPGIENNTIFPAPRRNPVMAAHPTLNLLIVSGGNANDQGITLGDLNDMWRFNLDTNAWTWFAGSIDKLSLASLYGSQGSASYTNFPGGRNSHSMCVDASNSVIYMFGGMLGQGSVYLNDMWSYGLDSGLWTWISGGENIKIAVSGPSGIFHPSYTPAGRSGITLTKIYNSPYLSVFGGYGYGIGASLTYGYNLNEMWLFDTGSGQWAWLAGLNGGATYGTKGVTTVGPYPQARYYYASVSLTLERSMILFGGFTGSFLNDMWNLNFKMALDPVVSTTKMVATTSSAVSVALELTSSTSTARSTSSSRLASSSAAAMPAVTTSSTRRTSTMASSSVTRVTLTQSYTLVPVATSTVTPDVSQQNAANSADSADMGASSLSVPLIVAIIAAVLVAMAIIAFKMNQRGKRPQMYEAAKNDVELSNAAVPPPAQPQQTAEMDNHDNATVSSGHSTTQTTQTSLNTSAVTDARSAVSATAATSATTATYAVPMNLRADATYDFRLDQAIGDDGRTVLYAGTGLVPQLKIFGPAILVKVVAETREQIHPAVSDAFDHELRVLSLMSNRSPHVVSLLAWTDQPVAILTKLYSHGTVEQWLVNKLVGNKVLKVLMWLDIARGLQVLHEMRVAHGDVRPGSIYVDMNPVTGRPVCLLGNFVAAKVYSQRGVLQSPIVTSGMLSVAYAAPEVILRVAQRRDSDQHVFTQDFQADLYSLGVLAMELLLNGPAWYHAGTISNEADTQEAPAEN